MFKTIAYYRGIAFLLIILIIATVPVHAQSDGCNLLNSPPDTVEPTLIGWSNPSIVFNKGEVITWDLSVTGNGVITYTFATLIRLSPYTSIFSPGNNSSTGTISLSDSGTVPSTGQYYVQIGIDSALALITPTLSVSCSVPAVPSAAPSADPVFTDGRINDFDAAAPVVVYPVDSGLHIYSADGTILFIISAEQLADAPANPDSPVILVESNGVIFSRLPGATHGYWQINAPQYNGKTYVLIFHELFASGGYTSFELE